MSVQDLAEVLDSVQIVNKENQTDNCSKQVSNFRGSDQSSKKKDRRVSFLEQDEDKEKLSRDEAHKALTGRKSRNALSPLLEPIGQEDIK